MKRFVLALLKGYAQFISPVLHQALGLKSACRHYPSCSSYAQKVIGKYSLGKGVFLSARRLINCQPYFTI